ncbi:Calcium-dependent protein kinase 2 (PfCDPK2) [Durusdinium trenchii]|uniref:Calcium-dependent protein kinase 2 (PfCDPK2) n=1 Tax=Durusdinium trenchii TaxID=1381693 RepID=A0ABP0RMY5_9DINO
MASEEEEGELDVELDATDAHLTHLEKRVRMSSCMELVKFHASHSPKEVEVFLTAAKAELSEVQAKNFLFHTWLIRCYHNIRQEEAQTFGREELPLHRRRVLLRSGPERFSVTQLEVLNELLREDGALGHEVEILGSKLSEWKGQMWLALAATALCVGLMSFLSWRLLGREGASAVSTAEQLLSRIVQVGASQTGLPSHAGSSSFATLVLQLTTQVGTKYSTPVDMWSAGVLVYMMLSATPPFYAPTDNEVLRKVKTGSYNLSGEPWDSLPKPPKDLIASLMTVDPKKRPSADEALSCGWLS